MKPAHKTIAFWLFIFIFAAAVLNMVSENKGQYKLIQYSELVELAKAGKIEEVVFKEDREIVGRIKETVAENELNEIGKGTTRKPTRRFKTNYGESANTVIYKMLEENKVKINYAPPEKQPFWKPFLITWLPILVLVFFFILFLRQLQVGGGKAMSFGKSKARLLNESTNKVTFKDVAGVEEAKEELEEIVEFLKDPKKFTKLGGRIPKGVLLMGSPGTGKTLLAKAIAGEAGVPFFSISGSDFVEMFVGVGASRVRDLFEQGKKHAPCIIFIDEIDAVGRHRGAGLGGGHDEREQTLNQLLVEMDGFESNEGVILIAATNRPDVLDPALLRPGRFDRRVMVPPPDVRGREMILKVHAGKTPLDKGVDLAVIARGTPGFSGADLEHLVNEAALLAARNNEDSITLDDLELAKDKVLMGSERKSMIFSDEDRRITAFHEAGHTLVGKFMPKTDPIHKVTIIPRGRALGVTQTLPKEDRLNMDNEKGENLIAFMMGGRIAEEIVFHQKTSGAGNDIERATDVARRMVCEWGMSDVLGPQSFAGSEGKEVFLGRDIAQAREYSEQTAQLIDREVRSIIDRNYTRAKNILLEKKDTLYALAEALLEFETLSGDEVDLIIAGKQIQRKPEKKKPPQGETEKAAAGDEKKSAKGSGSEDDGGAAPVPTPA